MLGIRKENKMFPVNIQLDKEMCDNCQYYDHKAKSKYSGDIGMLYDCTVSCTHYAACSRSYSKGIEKGRTENKNDT